jgi:hypothetical protein
MWRIWFAYFIYYWGGLHRYMGHTQNLRHEYLRAAYYFAWAYQIDPSFVRARLDWANLLWRELQEYDIAYKALKQLVRDEVVGLEARFNLALLQVERGAYAGALAEFEDYLAQATPEDNAERWHTAVYQATLLQELFSNTPPQEPAHDHDPT